jgi:hypothetical protein
MAIDFHTPPSEISYFNRYGERNNRTITQARHVSPLLEHPQGPASKGEGSGRKVSISTGVTWWGEAKKANGADCTERALICLRYAGRLNLDTLEEVPE